MSSFHRSPRGLNVGYFCGKADPLATHVPHMFSKVGQIHYFRVATPYSFQPAFPGAPIVLMAQNSRAYRHVVANVIS